MVRVGKSRGQLCLAASLWFLLGSADATAQLNKQAPVYLPSDHWTRSALQRLATLGNVDMAAAARTWPASRADVASWFDQAQDDETTAQFFRHLLEREFRGAARYSIRLSAGLLAVENELQTGTMQGAEGSYVYPGPILVSDQRAMLLSGEVVIRPMEALAVSAHGTLRDWQAELEAAQLSARLGILDMWLGRRPFGLGRGLVLNETQTFDGAGLAIPAGLRVPLLTRLFPELTIARLERSGDVRHPWFLATRITVAPSSDVAIGLNRAAIFGGAGTGITAERVLLMLIAQTDVPGKDSDFENQVASLDVSVRTRLYDLPVGVYGELGADDSGWAFLRVPGMIAGLELPSLPGLPSLSAGLEVVHLSERTGRYPPWYQHGALADGWSVRGRLLGHPLGGAGTEWSLRLGADLSRVPLLARSRFFLRERAAENLLAPAREGRSAGGALELLLPWHRAQLQLHGQAEYGAGWQTTRVKILASVFAG